MVALLTLDEIRQMLSLESENSEDDLILRSLIEAASAAVSQHCGRSFVPRWETRYYDAAGEHISSSQLRLDDELLELKTLYNGDGTAINTADCLLLPYNRWPKSAIQIKSSTVRFIYSDSYLAAIQVDGVWGYHEDWPRAWENTGGSLSSSVDSTTTTWAVGAVYGSTPAGEVPRFQVLGYYRAEDEVVQVVRVNQTANTLTVLRGVLGTVATAHASGTTLYRYRPQHDVSLAALSFTAWLYRNRTNVGEKYQFLDGTQLIVNEAPRHIMLTLNAYRRLKLG